MLRHRPTLRLPLSFAVSATLLPLIAIGNACGGMEFCEEDSKECAPASGGSAASSGGSAGTNSSGGSSGNAQGGSTGSAGDGGEGQGGGSGSGSPCDLQAPEDGCVAPDVGIFVAPVLNDQDVDDNLGTKDDPVTTVARGLELALEQGVPLFLCNYTFEEQLLLDGAENVAIHGGFKCADWTYLNGAKATVAPAERGYALRIADSTKISISDVEFQALDGEDPGESSIAAFVSESDSISLTRVKLVAGNGVDGEDGLLTPFTYPADESLDGNDATGTDEGTDKTCECPAGDASIGGNGGNGGGSPGSGTAGQPALGGGAGGMYDQACAGTGTGGDGSDAPDEDEAAGASTYGSLDTNGWTPDDGQDGSHGTPGQGGGGGKGATDGGGGGGACGGCGGKGARGGKGGGSSIGLLLFQAAATLNSTTIETGDAGAGGSSVAGQLGQEGGVKGNGDGSACDGGPGGVGGDGGAGGGGAGGISVGVVWKTIEPTLIASQITNGAAGAKGEGGGAMNDGKPGLATETLEIP